MITGPVILGVTFDSSSSGVIEISPADPHVVARKVYIQFNLGEAQTRGGIYLVAPLNGSVAFQCVPGDTLTIQVLDKLDSFNADDMGVTNISSAPFTVYSPWSTRRISSAPITVHAPWP